MAIKINKLLTTYWLLRICYGTLFIAVGIDKFLDLLTHWQTYIARSVHLFIPISSYLLIRLFGISQIIIGLLLLSRWFYWGILLGLGNLIIIFFNLILIPNQTIVVLHDLIMIQNLFILKFITDLQNNRKN